MRVMFGVMLGVPPKFWVRLEACSGPIVSADGYPKYLTLDSLLACCITRCVALLGEKEYEDELLIVKKVGTVDYLPTSHLIYRFSINNHRICTSIRLK